jgi:hypothetical protein
MLKFRVHSFFKFLLAPFRKRGIKENFPDLLYPREESRAGAKKG